MRKAKWMVSCLGLLVTLLVGTQAHASLIQALDLAGLVAQADDVVVARVVSAHSRFDDRGRIVTDHEMQVEQTEKGSQAPGAMVIVRKLGGSVGDLGMQVAGEPSFTVGETVLLFGRRDAKVAVLRPVGMSQGALRILDKQGERWVQSLAQGASLVKSGATGTLSQGVAAVSAPRKLDDVLSEIRTLVAKK